MEGLRQHPDNRGVPMHLVRKHCVGAVRAGLDFETLLRESYIDLDPDDPRGEISRAQHLALILNVNLSLGDEAHGMARRSIPIGLNWLAMRAASTARTAEEAVEAFARFYERTSSPVRLRLSNLANCVEVRVSSDSVDSDQAAAVEEIHTVALMLNLNWLAGRKLTIQSFAVRDPLHPYIGRLHWAFDAPTHFGPCTLLRLASRQSLLAPRVPAVGEFMWDPLRFWIENDPRINCRANWANATLRVADLTKSSGVSERSLRRRLATDGHSFRHLRRNAIADAGVRQLIATDVTVEQIAAELGYSEARSFRRLLKAATGLTPAQIRSDRGLSVPQTPDVLLYGRIRELVRRMEA
jgi:AraC-like DNA-binding protein